MIRYRYVRHIDPPAPFVNVTLRCPKTGRQNANLPAQIDTAADRTILPGPIVRALALADDGRALFQGFAGDIVEVPVYFVEIQLHDRPATAVRAALGEREPYILLGRDVLRAHRILLDGPQSALEILV